MLKKLLGAMVGILIAVPAFAQNLLVNGSFESGLAPWNVLGAGWGVQNIYVAPNAGVLGAYNIISSQPGQDYFAGLSQVKPITAGQTAYATAKAATFINVQAFARAGILLEFLNSSGTVIPGSSAQTEIGGFSLYRDLYVAKQAPSGAVNVRIYVYIFASQAETLAPSGIALGGIAGFDDVVLSTAFIAPPVTPNLPVNGSFENGFVDWGLIYQPSWSIDTATVNQGTYSAKNVIQTLALPGQSFFSGAKQDLAYTGGPLFASAQVQTAINPASSGIAGIKLEFYNTLNPAPGATPLGSVQNTISGNNGWTRLDINGGGPGVTPPAGTLMVRLLLFTFANQGDVLANNGVAYFDDIQYSYSALPPNFPTSIINNGFENGLNAWSNLFGFPAAIGNIAHTGTYSAKKSVGIIPGADYYSQIYQNIYYNNTGAVYPTGTNVYATAYIQTAFNPVSKAKAGIILQFVDASGSLINNTNGQPITYTSNVVGGTTSWRYVYVTGSTPAGTVAVRVSGIEYASAVDSLLGGDAFYDDFAFSATTPLTPPVAQTTLLNGGYENGTADWDEFFFPVPITNNPANVYSGTYATEFTVDAGLLGIGLSYFAATTQDITLSPASVSANLSGYVKTNFNPFTGGIAGIGMQFLDNMGAQVGAIAVDLRGGITPYTPLNAFGTKPTGAVKLRVYVFAFDPFGNAQAGDQAWLDQINLIIQ